MLPVARSVKERGEHVFTNHIEFLLMKEVWQGEHQMPPFQEK